MRLNLPFSSAPAFASIQPVAMTTLHLPGVLHVEQSAYSHPWTHGNFIDSIASGYHMPVWFQDEHLLGYLVAMRGADELHLLNITVAPGFQRRGWGNHMLQTLTDWAASAACMRFGLKFAPVTEAPLPCTKRWALSTKGSEKITTPWL